MPRYFFHVQDVTEILDTLGTELSGLEAAKRCALTYAGDLIKDDSAAFWSGEPWRMTVMTDDDVVCFSLSFIATNKVIV